MKLFSWFGDFVYGKFLDGINKMKKVSVIIVSYNVRSYLAHAIDSILKSNYKKYEIIVVDNHSYDGTCDYLKENYQYIILGNAYLALIPALCLVFLVSSFMFLSNYYSDKKV